MRSKVARRGRQEQVEFEVTLIEKEDKIIVVTHIDVHAGSVEHIGGNSPPIHHAASERWSKSDVTVTSFAGTRRDRGQAPR